MRGIAAVVVGLAMLGTPGGGVVQEQASQGRFVVVDVANPAYHANQLFFAFENYYSPRMKELREKYGLQRGTAVRFVDYGGVMGIVPDLEDPIKHGFGMLKGRRLTQRLLDEHKKDRETES